MKKKFVSMAFLFVFSFMFISPLCAAPILPSDDGYALSWMPTYRNPNAVVISVGVTSNGTIQSFLKFDLTGYNAVSIGSANLFLRTVGSAIANPPNVGVYTTSTGWTEATLDWNTKPALSGTPVNQTVNTPNTWYTWDVTSIAKAAAGGQLSLGLASPAGAVSFHSFENGTAAFRPYLDITAPAPVPIPAAAWLFGSGLLGLIGFKRKIRE